MHTIRISSLTLAMVLTCGALPRVEAQVTIKPPSSRNQQEAQAVEVVRGWISAWNAYDLNKLSSYMSDQLVFRADVSEPLQYGREAFLTVARGVINGWCGIDLEEIFVIGGARDTMVLLKRVDYFPGDGGFTPFRGMAIPVATMLRVRQGKIVEWLDAPLIPVGPGAPPPAAAGRSGGAPGDVTATPPPSLSPRGEPVGPCK